MKIARIALLSVAATFAMQLMGQQNGQCSGSSLANQTWAGARFGGNATVTFESSDRFVYTVRDGARTMISARGGFTIRRAGQNGGERFPSGCHITFDPSELVVKPKADDQQRLQTNGLLDGSKQTFWIEKKAPRWEPEPFLELLSAVIWESDPGSTHNFTLNQRR